MPASLWNPANTLYIDDELSYTPTDLINDGVTDNFTALQTAIVVAETAGKRFLAIPAGTYALGQKLQVKTPIIILGMNWGDASSAASQPTEPVTSLLWIGSAVGTDPMILFQAETSGNRLWGAGIDGIALKGNNSAYNGVVFSSPYMPYVGMLWVERVRNIGMLFDDSNGTLCNAPNIDFYQYQAGSNPAAANSRGLVIRSELGHGCTGLTANTLSIFTDAGNCIEIGDHDNGVIKKVIGGSTSGYGILFRGLTDSQTRPARKNFIFEFGGGEIYCETASKNVVQWINSESTSVTIETLATLYYNVLDRKNGRMFLTQAQVTADRYSLDVKNFYAAAGTPVYGTIGSIGAQAILLDPAATETCVWTFRIPPTWHAGKITGIEILGYPAGSGGGNVVFSAGIASRPIGTGVSPVLVLESFTKSVAATAITEKQTLTFATPYAVFDTSGEAEDTIMIVQLSRTGGSGSDTFASDYGIIDIRLLYQADVADSDLPGQYRYTPSPYVAQVV